MTDWLGGRTAVELRLWEALDRGLPSPFQYFGVSDDTDLSRLEFKRGRGYDPKVLEGVYIRHDARARIIAQAVRDKVTSIAGMRTLGFCVGGGARPVHGGQVQRVWDPVDRPDRRRPSPAQACGYR